jgi:hypothetical protein
MSDERNVLDWFYEPIFEPTETRVSDLDLSMCYRIFTSFTENDPVSKREDVLSPTHEVTVRPDTRMGIVKKRMCARLFYVGAEIELDRYINWLTSVYFWTDTDDPAPLYVARQHSCYAQAEVAESYPKDKVVFVAPGELEHYGLLAGSTHDPSTTELF